MGVQLQISRKKQLSTTWHKHRPRVMKSHSSGFQSCFWSLCKVLNFEMD
jgi:hypothetical protein